MSQLTSNGQNIMARSNSLITLVGSGGGPTPLAGRSGTCTALTVEGATYLIDMGHGSFTGLHQAQFDVAEVRAVFITHLHSDHIAELFQLPFLRHGGLGALRHPLHILGPGRAGALPPARSGQQVSTIAPDNPTPGTVDLMELMAAGAAYDLNIRMRDEGWPSIWSRIKPRDIQIPEVGANAHDEVAPAMEPFTVFEDENVQVSAILVDHPPVFPAFAYRFETASGSLVVSGDTGPSKNIVKLAAGADVLIHEVIDMTWVKNQNLEPDIVAHLEESHTSVDLVGQIAQDAGVEHLVLNHLVPADINAVTAQEWRRRAQAGFDGQVTVGQDLLEINMENLVKPVPTTAQM